MRIVIDAELCSGQGRCYAMSPDLLVSDDEGFVEQRGTDFDVPAGLEGQARIAVDSCPEGAISLVET